MTADHGTAVLVVPPQSQDGRLWMARTAWLTGYKPSTRATYAEGLDKWLRWCTICQLDPLNVQRAHIDLFGRWLEEEKQLQPATIMHRLCVLRSFYRYCEDEQIIDKSPAARCRLPRVSPESRTHGMTREEVTRFIFTSERVPVQHALVCLLALNGLRVGEACNLNIEDLGIELGHRTISIVRKGGKPQRLPMSPKTARAVDRAIADRTSGPVLVSKTGRRVTRGLAGDMVSRIGRRANLGYHVHCHMLRHAFVTTALAAGALLQDVQDSAGHADPRTTRRYDRARGQLDRNSTHLVTAFLATG